MTKPNIPNNSPGPTTQPEPASIHQAFSWLPLEHRTDPHAQFIAMTNDICLGVQTCIDLAHFSTMDRGSDTKPVLDTADTDRLLRMASMSSQMLADVAESRIDRLKRQPDQQTEYRPKSL